MLMYSEGRYKEPAPAYWMVRLTRTCPAGGSMSEIGVYVAGSPSKTAMGLTWADVLAAVAWAAKRSAAVRADLKRILAETEPVAAECPMGRIIGPAAVVSALESLGWRHQNTMWVNGDRSVPRSAFLEGEPAPVVSSLAEGLLRLARVLAVERGDWREAPPGWEPRGADMWVRGTRPGRPVIQRWHRDGRPTQWLRRGEIDGPRWPTALDAMEAIDAAEVSDG